MAQRNLFKFSKYYHLQHRSISYMRSNRNRMLLNNVQILNPVLLSKRNEDSRKLMYTDDCQLIDAGEARQFMIQQYGPGGQRPYPFVRKADTQMTLEDWHVSKASIVWTSMFLVVVVYLYYIRQKQQLWMRTDHPEYYANHPMNRKANIAAQDENNETNENSENNETQEG